MLNRSASLAMSTSVLKALPGKLDIKRRSPSILYICWLNCGFRSITFEGMHQFHLNFTYGYIIMKYRSGSNLGVICKLLIELFLFDLILYVHSTIFQLCGTGLPGLNQY